jgi:peptidoglycan-associated lipoprotein
MRSRIKTTLALLLTVAAVSALRAQEMGKPAATDPKPYRMELEGGYTYLHSNAPPGGCGCFNLNGGNATFAWPVMPGRFALVGDFTIAHAGTIASSGDTLTLSTFTAGGRYLPRLSHSSLQPFGQALIGFAHASGPLVQGANPGAANAGAAFAANLGGGLDLKASRRFSIRLIEADYLLTTFDNGSNNHQNNLQVRAGVVVHFGEQ